MEQATKISLQQGIELQRTPLVENKKTGRWALFLIEGKELEWGHRFDAGLGYRVYIKFKDSWMANVFLPEQARRAAFKMAKGECDKQTLAICNAISEMAEACQKLNEAWAAAGCPDMPLDKIGSMGNA